MRKRSSYRIKVRKHKRRLKSGNTTTIVRKHYRNNNKKLRRTQTLKKASALKREKKYGVGKTIGGFTYVHSNYEDVLPERVKEAKEKIPSDFPYNIIKYNNKTSDVYFIHSPDFDIANEPIVGDSWFVSNDNKIVKHNKAYSNKLYHHKWLFVKEDYPFFNVELAKSRSETWLSIPGIDKNKIGHKKYWEDIVIPKIQDIEMMIKTGQKRGIFAKNPILTRLILCENFPKDVKILDFGAGTNALQAQKIKEKYPNTKAYDYPLSAIKSIIQNPKLFEIYDLDALNKDYDIIIASNVLNVQPNVKQLENTLNKIYCSMDRDTILFLNLPREPIKVRNNGCVISYPEFVKFTIQELEQRFGQENVIRIREVCDEKTHSYVLKIIKEKDGHGKVFCS